MDNQKLKQAYEKARAERKVFEQEIAEIDEKIRQATLEGRVEEAARLRQRKQDLPALFAGASNAESEARRVWHQAELKAAGAVVKDAEATLESHREEKKRLIAEHEERLEEFARKDIVLVDALNTARSNAERWSKASFDGDRAFKAALSALAA